MTPRCTVVLCGGAMTRRRPPELWRRSVAVAPLRTPSFILSMDAVAMRPLARTVESAISRCTTCSTAVIVRVPWQCECMYSQYYEALSAYYRGSRGSQAPALHHNRSLTEGPQRRSDVLFVHLKSRRHKEAGSAHSSRGHLSLHTHRSFRPCSSVSQRLSFGS